MATPIFDQAQPKIFQAPFNLDELVPECKKSVNYICSFFRYSQFYSLVARLATPISDHANLNNFQATFNLHEFVPACKKSVHSICSFFR